VYFFDPPLERATAVLSVRDLSVSYGRTQVLFGVDLDVAEGEIVALLGTNGAGKSTVLRAVTGLVPAQQGTVTHRGRDITHTPADQIAAGGIAMMPGGRGVFPSLSVAENLELGGWLHQGDRAALDSAIAEVLELFPPLRERWGEKAGNLSGGEQQMVTLGQTLLARPELLMIDELSLGLSPALVQQLVEIIKGIHARGITIVIVEQSVHVAAALADRAVFMEKGTVRFDGPIADLLHRPDLLRPVFISNRAVDRRGPHGVLRPSSESDRAPVALEVSGVSVEFGGRHALQGIDLAVESGRIVGLIGANGAGKTTLLEAIAGFVDISAGAIAMDGVDVSALSPERRAAAGLGHSFQDATLFPSMTVRETLAVALERHVPTRDPLAALLVSPSTRLSERKVAARVDELIELFHLQAYANKFIGELSVGTRRVTDLACAMAHGPKVHLFDEPSSGMAQRETEALGPLLLDIRAKTGAALVVIEHDMPLITSVADELVALELGQVIARGDPKAVVEDERVIASYLGAPQPG
jgi:branched-chain amino acid transport system ATP-binding protein